MATIEKRLEDIIKELSPEDKARLVIEDCFREKPTLSPAEMNKMLEEMGNNEGRRYNAVIQRYRLLRLNYRTFSIMATNLKEQLLNRDRLLMYLMAAMRIEMEITRNPKLANPLLVDNPNVKPGKPLESKIPFATIHLGVEGKERHTQSESLGIISNKETDELAVTLASCIRDTAGELKAIYRYIKEESDALGLPFVCNLAAAELEEVVGWDRPLRRGREEEFTLPRSVFPVPPELALAWEDIPENHEIAKRIRDDPSGWWPLLYGKQTEAEVLGDVQLFLNELEETKW